MFNKKIKLVVVCLILILLPSAIVFARGEFSTTTKKRTLKVISSQQCSSGMYYKQIFPEVIVKKDILYGKAKNIKNEEESLFLDLYIPKKGTLTPSPMIIFAHGGGYRGGDKAGTHFVEYLESLAKMGYITASVNYRLGVESPVNEKTYLEAEWRAQQDLRAAVRFAHANANKIGVDTERIFLNGSSVGATISLDVAFLEQSEAPKIVDQTKWGDVSGTSGSVGYDENVAAVVSFWGGVENVDIIRSASIPIGLIHGKYDPSVPYNVGKDKSGLVIYGSLPIYKAAQKLNLNSELKTYDYEGHEEGLRSKYLKETIDWTTKFLYPLTECGQN